MNRSFTPWTWVLTLLALPLCACSAGGGANGGGGSGGEGRPSTDCTADLEWPPCAKAYFDEHGILSADCKTDEDCSMVLGYYHARDRFVQMELQRRIATGSITEIVHEGLVAPGPIRELLMDIATSNRALYSTRDGEPLEAAVLRATSPKTLGLLEAYAAGVNQWLDEVRRGDNDAQWPRELQHGFFNYGPEDAPDWTPSDSIAAVTLLLDLLTNTENRQRAAGAALAEIDDPARFSDLFSRRPVGGSSILEPEEYEASQTTMARPKHGAARDSDLLRRAMTMLARPQGPVPRQADEIGSNSWVLGPSMTANGGTLLSNDPHLNMSQPAIWYLAHLDAKTHGSGEIHTAGLTLAALPYVIIGQNEDIAWGSTNSLIDLSDVYVEELVKDDDGEPFGAIFEGEVLEFKKVEHTFDFRDGTSETRALLFHPEHGPVRSVDLENMVAVTLRWTGQDISTDLDFFTGAARATSVEEFRAAAENTTTTGLSAMSIDRDGNFGWFPYNRIPKRPWAAESPTWLPIDGTGAYEWEGYFDLSELPQSLNRETGYIVTANNDQTGTLQDGDPNNDGHPPFQTEAAAGFRHERIVELLEESEEHTVDSMLSIVGDTQSLYGRNMTPKILDMADDPMMPALSDAADRVVAALRPWTYHCPSGLRGSDPEVSPLAEAAEVAESAGCAAFHVLLNALEERLANDEPHYDWFVTYFSIVDPGVFAAGDVYWDNVKTESVVETKFDIMSAALEAAGRTLVDRLGDDLSQWAWGRMHGLVLRSDLSGLTSLFNQFDNPPSDESFYATPGGLRTVNMALPEADGLHTDGVSARLICEGLPEGMSCIIQLPGGQSSHVDSPNYDDLLPLWLRNEPIDLIFDIEEAEANAVITVAFE